MRVGRSKNSRTSQRASSRVLALESLGSRVVLSAGGWGGGVAEMDLQMPAYDGATFDAPAVMRPLDAMPARSIIEAGGAFGKVPEGSWMAPPAGLHGAETGRPFGPLGDAMSGSPHVLSPGYYVVAQSLASSAGFYSLGVVLPPTVTLTFVINAPMFPTAQQLKVYDFDPPPRGWAAGPGADMLRLAAGAVDRGAAPQLAMSTTHSDAGPAVDLAGATNRLTNFVQTQIAQNTGNENRTVGGWLSPVPSAASATVSAESVPQSKVTLAPNRWDTSTDLEGGLIELESPTLPRAKRSLKAGDNLSDEETAANELQKLLDQVWSGWDRVWDASGEIHEALEEEARSSNDAVASAASDQATKSIMADAEGGMIELATPAALAGGPLVAGPGPAYLVQTPVNDGEKVRIDAGVALYQSFELATAPDAAPPASAANTNAANGKAADAGSAGDKNAKSKEPSSAEHKSTSAALLGVGLLLSVPTSVFRIRRQDETEAVRPQGLLKVERID